MEIRPIKELLILLRESIIDRKYKDARGICFYVIKLFLNDKISNIECFALINHIKDNRPNEVIHKEFTDNDIYLKNSPYFWRPIRSENEENNQELEIRLKFIDKLIDLA